MNNEINMRIVDTNKDKTPEEKYLSLRVDAINFVKSLEKEGRLVELVDIKYSDNEVNISAIIREEDKPTISIKSDSANWDLFNAILFCTMLVLGYKFLKYLVWSV